MMRPPSMPGAPQLRVLALTAVLALASALLALPLVTSPSDHEGRHLPLLALAACYLAFEPVQLHLRVRRNLQHTQTVTFSEIPLALGLLFASPGELLLIGSGVAVLFNLWRRMDPLKQAFNATNRFCDLAIALAVYTALVPADPFSSTGWLVLLAAVSCSGTATAFSVTAAITLSTGCRPRYDPGQFLLSAAPASAVVGTIGFGAALMWQSGTSGTGPLVACLGLVLLGLRAFSLLTERHSDLIDLHGWSQRLTPEDDVDVVLERVLAAAVDLLKAEVARIYLLDRRGAACTLVRHRDDGSLEHVRSCPDDVPTLIGVDGRTSSVHARASLGPGQTMVLTVSGRPRAMRVFRAEDARLLAMVADQAALALRNGQLIDRLRQEALQDALTGLPNRAALVEALALRTADPGRSQVLWLGVRDQQVVNEALGYDSGDELLRQVAARLGAAAGVEALVARVDGDEFAVLAPCTAAETWCTSTTAAVAECFAAPFTLFGVQVAVRVSIGQSETARPGLDTPLHLLRQADTAMRAARRSGHDLQHYTPELETGTADRLALVVDLQEGIGRGELVLYAQPQVRLSDGAVTGMEALVRWQHPQLGLLPPGVFLPLAEQTRLDEPLTLWVLDTALEAVAAWRRSGLELTVAVNVPARAVSDPTLCHSVAAALTKHGLPGSVLVIEITESGLLDNPAGAAEVLTQLALLDITVSVDDFGTGFSSLSLLKRLPVDEIKIDRSFVSSMLSDQDDAAIVRSVIQLASGLGLSCVAEGIEDEATYAALQNLGCDLAQGYLMAAPMPVAAVSGWIAARAAAAVVPPPRPRVALTSVATG